VRTFTLTNKAKADLKSIAVYTQRKWGIAQRRVYIKHFDDTFQMLSEKPETGNNCDFIKPGYLKFPAMSHIIFYRNTSSSAIEVIRILHKRMDAKGKLEKP